MTYDVRELEDRLKEVFYMVRNYHVADDEETRIYEVLTDPKTGGVVDDGMCYLGTLPEPIRGACLTLMKQMDSHLVAIDIFCRYWLREASSCPEFIKKEFDKWLEVWLDDYSEDEEMMQAEKEQAEHWYQTVQEWSYWR